MQVKSAFVFFAVIFLSACCATQYRVNVNSLVAGGGPGGITYVILPGNSGIPPGDLQFIEFSKYVGKVVEEKGYIPAVNGENADVAVFLSYGVGNPRDFSYVYAFPAGKARGLRDGIKTEKPSHSVKGYETYSGRYNTHFRFVFLDAYDLRRSRQTGTAAELWETSITSAGSNNDMRFTFPILLAGAKGYVGVDTGSAIEIILDQEDARVRALKSGDPAPEANWREDFRVKLNKK
jgi:hypothetical protein